MKITNRYLQSFKFNFLITLLIASNVNVIIATRMYLFFTPSHEQLFTEFFLPSLQDDYELVINRYEQISESAMYMQEGWNQTVIKKIEMIINACKKNNGEIFLYSDVDIQFFKPTREVVFNIMANPNIDIVIQQDHPSGTACTGFLACRASERTLLFWLQVRDIMLENIDQHKGIDDQGAFNIAIHSQIEGLNIQWCFLPNTFMGPGMSIGTPWNPGNSLIIPKDIVMHHANYTVGISNKIKQLKYVKSVVFKSVVLMK